MTRNNTRRLAALLVPVLLGLAACGQSKVETTAHKTPSPTPAPSPLTRGNDTTPREPEKPAAAFDLQFIDTMSRHHRDAIEMGRLAATQGNHAELQAYGAKILADRERQVTLLSEWRTQWYPGAENAVNTAMPGMKRLGHADLDSLSGDAFDLKFIDRMIPHHEGAVTMARAALEKAAHEELKALSQQIVDVQQQEIGLMTQWKTAWSIGAATP